MAKELPYFKFEPGAWDNGNIQLCSFELQGIFINICSMYWQRLGDLPYELAMRKVCGGNATALKSLCDHKVMRIENGSIFIGFLDEQLQEFESISSKNSENAKAGWAKRKKDATALPPQSERNAIREDKIREEEKREEWFKWGEMIVSGCDQFWEQMNGRKISREEMESFISVATRNNWTMNTQNAFRVSLKGFNNNNHVKVDKNPYKIQ